MLTPLQIFSVIRICVEKWFEFNKLWFQWCFAFMDNLEGILWHKLAGPLSTLLMPLLGAVAAFGLARSGALFVRAVLGMALGFTYFVADNFALAMGNLGAYPPWIAAWGPFLLFLLIGETVLIRTEE